MKKYIIVFLLFTITFSGYSLANTVGSIGEMMEYCKKPNGNLFKTHCFSYISGIIDIQGNYGLKNLKRIKFTCFPKDITAKQGAAIFVKWAHNNPEQHHNLAYTGIVQSLFKAFPCSAKN